MQYNYLAHYYASVNAWISFVKKTKLFGENFTLNILCFVVSSLFVAILFLSVLSFLGTTNRKGGNRVNCGENNFFSMYKLFY